MATVKDGSSRTVVVPSEIPASVTARLNWRGDWAVAAKYKVNDAVYYAGESFVAILDHTAVRGTEPGTGIESRRVWSILARKTEQALTAAQQAQIDSKAPLGHQHTSNDIEDMTDAGRALVIAEEPAEQREALGIFSFATRAALVAAVAAGLVGTHKTAVHAEGLEYQWYALSTAIPDLPGLVPATPHVDPMHWGADNTGGTASQTAFARAITHLKAKAAFSGNAHFKPSAGKYRVDWDGATGMEVGFGVVTGINQRCCFLIENAHNLSFDFTGVEIVHGGSNRNQWATFMMVRNSRTPTVFGGTFDYVNKPYTQGTIYAIDMGAATPYVDVQLEAGYVPTFSQAGWITLFSDDDVPLQFGVHSSTFSETPWTFTNTGGGIWRVTGFGSNHISTITYKIGQGYFQPGDRCMVWDVKDGAKWFMFVNCDAPKVVGATFYTAVDLAIGCYECKDEMMLNNVIGRRPGTNDLLVNSRGGIMSQGYRGYTDYRGNKVSRTGDDGLAVANSVIEQMTRLSSTTFEGFFHSQWWGSTLPVGTKLQFLDATGAQVATATITNVAAASNYARRIFTVAFDTGSMPVSLTDHVADPISAYERKKAIIAHNTVTEMRGRAIYGVVEGGLVVDNIIENCTGQGILISGWNSHSSNLHSGTIDGLLVSRNKVYDTCIDGYYGGAIMVLPKDHNTTDDANDVQSAYGWKNVVVKDNVVRGTRNAAIIVAGCERPEVIGNHIDEAGSQGFADQDYDVGSGHIISLNRCRNAFIDGNKAANIHARVLVAEVSCTGTIYGVNTNLDADTGFGTDGDFGVGTKTPSYRLHAKKSGASCEVMIETTLSFSPKLRLKNGDREFSTFAGQFGWFLRDETAGLNRMNVDTSGNWLPITNHSQNLGSPSVRFNNVYGRYLWGADGDTAPSAISGLMAYYRDGTDGRLKAKRGDGTVLGFDNGGHSTISTDADATITVFTTGRRVRHTGTLTADRTLTLSGGVAGDFFRITRTGGGAFNLSVGGLKNLATNTWCEVAHDGTGWYLSAYDTL